MHTPKIPITIMLPVYNASNTIRECIDSILNQSFGEFELIIADDGSTDDSFDIASTYSDNRIQLYKRNHDFIGTLNFLMKSANGKYLVRMDADDVMMPDRLRIQYDYMERNPHIAASGGAIELYDNGEIIYNVPKITPLTFLEGCGIFNPTAIIRKDVVLRHNLSYNAEFIYAEDFHFWVEMTMKSLNITNLKHVLIKYRRGKHNVSNVHRKEQEENTRKEQRCLLDWFKKETDSVKNDYVVLPITKNKLSICISFLNEGVEVGNTVRSIRATAGNSVDIVIVNDASDDGYDYESDLKDLGVNYVVNQHRIGSSAGKEKAVQISNTEYFLLLDAHMRFYQNDWVKILIDELNKDQNQILCCQNIVLTKNKDEEVSNDGEIGVYGAYLMFDENDYIPQIKWNSNYICNLLGDNNIPAVLGASYCTSKTYWNKIKGLQGLMQYGAEESYLSIKAWMEGGGCKFIDQVKIGHIYRKEAPYRMCNPYLVYNHLVISYTLFPHSEHLLTSLIAKKKNEKIYNVAKIIFDFYKEELECLKDYYNKNLDRHDYNYIKLINETFPTSQINLIAAEKDRLRKIISDIGSSTSYDNSLSVFNGKAGQMLALALYANIFNDDVADDKASDCFNIVLEQLQDSDLPYGFNNGYAGIGWVLLYLIENKLTEEDLTKELTFIDRKMEELNLPHIKDHNFEKGAGGIIAYVYCRIQSYRKNQMGFPFKQEYIEEVYKACDNILSEGLKDIRTFRYAALFVDLYKGQQNFYRMSVQSVFQLPDFLPKDTAMQKCDMSGNLGFSINQIITISKKTNSHKIQ